MKVDVYKIDGTKAGEQLELAPEVFGVEPNDQKSVLRESEYSSRNRTVSALP